MKCGGNLQKQGLYRILTKQGFKKSQSVYFFVSSSLVLPGCIFEVVKVEIQACL